MDHGWLAPPVRVAIGIIVGIALLVMCERTAARRYPVTANALDAAAIRSSLQPSSRPTPCGT